MSRLILRKFQFNWSSATRLWSQSSRIMKSTSSIGMAHKATFSPNQCIYWILDFDGTITKQDTLNTLVKIAAANKPDSSVLNQWKEVVQSYLDDYNATIEKLIPSGKYPETLEDERRLLENLKPVEYRSLDRVFASAIFKDLTNEQVLNGTKGAIELGRVELRPGLPAIFNHAANHGGKVSIFSVNWSRCFISATLKAVGIDIDSNSILSNELEGIQEGRSSTGRIVAVGNTMVVSSSDKLNLLESIRQRDTEPNRRLPIVYVGDSWTDFECLLAADLGICIRDAPMSHSQKQLAGALRRLDIPCANITELTNCDGQELVWAKDFTEIEQWIRGWLS